MDGEKMGEIVYDVFQSTLKRLEDNLLYYFTPKRLNDSQNFFPSAANAT